MKTVKQLTLYPGFLKEIKRYVSLSALFCVIILNGRSLRDSEKVTQCILLND